MAGQVIMNPQIWSATLFNMRSESVIGGIIAFTTFILQRGI